MQQAGEEKEGEGLRTVALELRERMMCGKEKEQARALTVFQNKTSGSGL